MSTIPIQMKDQFIVDGDANETVIQMLAFTDHKFKMAFVFQNRIGVGNK